MKKFLFLFSTMILLFASCEGPAGRDGFDGRDLEVRNVYITIKPQKWERVDVGTYATLYKCVENVNIGMEAYERGIVIVSLFQWDQPSDVEVKTPLPYWTQHTEGNNTWLEGYNYDYDHGSIAFYVECRNGTTPPECNYHVAITP